MPVNLSDAFFIWPAGVSQPAPTEETARLNPFSLLRGTDGQGERREQLALNNAVLFNAYDGTQVWAPGTEPPEPPNFSSPSRQEFLNWHSYHQIRYLQVHGATTNITDGADTLTVRSASIGGNADPLLNLNVVLSADGRRVIVLNTLQLTDVARLSFADQRLLAGLELFHQVYSSPLGLVPNSLTQDATGARNALYAEIDLLIADIQSRPDYVSGQQATFDSTPSARSDLYHYLSVGQLDIMKERLAGMAIFAPDVIKRSITEIHERFDRLNAYVLATRPTSPFGGLLFALNGLDAAQDPNTLAYELPGLVNAQNILKKVELQLYELAKDTLSVARTGTYDGHVLDAPSLIFLFQKAESYASEARAEALTEEMNQLNRLLQDYTALQKLLNETLNKYNPVGQADTDTIERLGIKGNGSSFLSSSNLSEAERLTVMMFDKTLAFAASNSFHPLERKNNVTRPTENIIYSNGLFYIHSKDIWDKLAVNIAEATKLLNQDSQIRMDEVSKLNSAKNRHYDLATGTLTKLSDILLSIIN